MVPVATYLGHHLGRKKHYEDFVALLMTHCVTYGFPLTCLHLDYFNIRKGNTCPFPTPVGSLQSLIRIMYCS